MQLRAARCVRCVVLALPFVAAVAGCVDAQNANRRWTFEQLLRPPTAAELQRVDRDWTRRKLAVNNIKLVDTASVPVGAERFEARLYTYALNDSQRCGAVLLPPARDEHSLAGLVDIGDIRWDYPDRDLTNGPYVAKILGNRARDFVLVVPCARGMALRVNDLRVGADGDRRDAWEGVAEDAIAFLTVALSTTREIDPKTLGVYGYSRGGGVALIAGKRDGASPLFFTERLPAFQIHQGEDDRPVPARNAILVRDRLAPTDSQRVFIYSRAGHVLDDTPALATAREFLVERLVAPRESKK